MTIKLFEENPYQKEFSAKIISQAKTSKGFEVILDQTCFYPGGGGQECDLGFINNKEVINVYKNDQGEIIHFIKEEIKENEITGIINWERRFRNMQQHSGQHVLSGVLFNNFHAQTLSAEFSHTDGTILLDRVLTFEEIEKVVYKANEIILSNLPITTKYIELSEMDKYHLVKPPKEKFAKTGKIRIWHINNFYTIPCGGTHCKTTGEIGCITVFKQLEENGKTLLHFANGFAAIEKSSNAFKIIDEVSKKLQTAPLNVLELITKKIESIDKLENQLKIFGDELAFTKAKIIKQNPVLKNKISFYIFSYSQNEQQFVKKILYQLTENENTIAIAKGKNLPISISFSKNLQLNPLPLLSELLKKYNGKGGGNAIYWQAMVENQEEFIDNFIKNI